MFCQLSRISLFGVRRVYVHIENQKWQEVFLGEINSILPGK
jgi:hypothetical protein